ncbi:unnamed protein product [Paramecium sonneborni]|uniref:C2H2-type domain-containing protein n=1 Tax=Paramecium sonneborni TaxID=65129 RepID=A0A8S1LEP3_9CILI|nr:unnamed protein product [Paramecium sonneborni]
MIRRTKFLKQFLSFELLFNIHKSIIYIIRNQQKQIAINFEEQQNLIMRSLQQIPKVTKKVIIINQKSNMITENNNLQNIQNVQVNNTERKNAITEEQLPKQFDDNLQFESQQSIQEMMILYQKNCTQLQEFQYQIHELKERVQLIEQKFEEIETTNKKKKKRRTAAEIDKNFKCPYKNCEKLYGSDVSLNLHIKFKHNGGNKSERQKIIKQLQAGEISEKDIPNINLPPV